MFRLLLILPKLTKLILNSEFVNLSLYDQLHQYLTVRPSINGSFFCHFNHEKVTRYQETVILKSGLRFLGYNENDYNTHSFRIGAATHAAKMGKSDDEIMTMGRWKSDSYKKIYKNRHNNLIHLKSVGNSLVISELPLSRYIWILGSSIILHAEKHIKSRFTGHNLGLQVLGYSVLWAGISGMRWDEIVPIVHSMTNCFGIPEMVLIHCGGNDIGIDPCGKLLFHLKFAVYVISKMLPGSMIVYSNVLPRRT